MYKSDPDYIDISLLQSLSFSTQGISQYCLTHALPEALRDEPAELTSSIVR